MLSDILSRHRGPFLFCVQRPVVNVKHSTPRFKSEWLKSDVASEDVGEEAMALLSDPAGHNLPRRRMVTEGKSIRDWD